MSTISTPGKSTRFFGAVLGIFVGGNLIILSWFLEQVVIGVVAGHMAFGACLLGAPSFAFAAAHGRFPATPDDSRLDTVHPGAAAVALALGSLALFFAGFIVGQAVALIIGVGTTAAMYVFVDRTAARSPMKTPDSRQSPVPSEQASAASNDDSDTSPGVIVSGLSVLSGIVLVSGLGAVGESRATGVGLIVGAGALLVIAAVVHRRQNR